MSGRILFLHGLTSSGKSSIARCLAELCPTPLYQSSNDTFHDMISGKFFAAGFWRAVASTIGAQYYAVRGMAEAGFDVVVDGMGLDLDEFETLFGLRHADFVKEVFRGLDVFFVRVDCPLEELRRRNLVRGDRGEFQSEEQARLADPDFPADLVLDAMTIFPDEAALRILDAAGLPADPVLFFEEADAFRASLLRRLPFPAGTSVAPVLPEDSGLTKIRPHAPLCPVETDILTSDPDAVGRELLRRGYRRAGEPSDGPIRLYARGEEGREICRVLARPADDLLPWIGKTVAVSVDRPAGSVHPEHPDMRYPIPYGYVEGTLAADGEPADAYCVGFENAPSLTGDVAAVIRRDEDLEEKLVVCPPGKSVSAAEILSAVDFTERYFHSELVLKA